MYGGRDIVDDAQGTNLKGKDCAGYGTHCAGTAGGIYSGVAKRANIYSIRVLSCEGWGYKSWSILGIIYVNERHNSNKDRSDYIGSIISMSLGGSPSTAQDNAVNWAVKNGIVIVTSSGNSANDTCECSPGRAGLNINVGAHSYDSSYCKKPMAYLSNYGPCVDIMAPGVNINSASYTSNTGFIKMSGTSMACPHVAGLAALMKTGNRDLTPNEIDENIKSIAIDDIDRSAMSNEVRAVSHAKRMYVTSDLIA